MRIYLTKVRLNSGGYDSDGRYFGNVRGTAVYYYTSDFADVWGHVRAVNRNDARREILAKFPTAIIRK